MAALAAQESARKERERIDEQRKQCPYNQTEDLLHFFEEKVPVVVPVAMKSTSSSSSSSLSQHQNVKTTDKLCRILRETKTGKNLIHFGAMSNRTGVLKYLLMQKEGATK